MPYMSHDAFEDWLRQHLPEAAQSLRPPASEADLTVLATETGLDLPPAFLDLYRWHDGQERGCTGVFYGLEFLPISRVLEEWRFAAREAESLPFAEATPTAVVRRASANRHWIPFAADGGGNFLAIDLQPGPRGARGQVINFGRDEILQYALTRNVSEFIDWVVGELARGNVSIGEGAGNLRPFNLAEPPTHHLLDATRVIFGGGRPPAPAQSGPPRDSTPGVLELIRGELKLAAPATWQGLRLRAVVTHGSVALDTFVSVGDREDFQPLEVRDRRVLEEAVLELQARTREERWIWSKITLDYAAGKSSIAADTE
jgi:cell wall assembly regulator SMI1